ncbi:hypothetical protein GCM10027422_43340 [Hymenobacter arcticus]
MAAPPPSATGWRLFGVLCFVLLLSMAYNSYQHYLNSDLHRKNEYITNNYRVVRDSLRRPPPPPPVVVRRAPTVICKAVPVSEAQLTSLRAGLLADFSQQLRRELARQSLRPVVASRQQLPVVALRDTVLRKRVGTTGQVVSTAAKTGTFQDKWLSLTGVVKPGRPGRPDSLEVKYQLRSEFDVQAYSRRDQKHWWLWPFRPRRVYVRLQSRNPNVTTTHLDSVRVQKH